ncbi:hypothetical protein TNCV_1900531 [Trichonephila clavipes]|nr:hypothetical protein TNCV_1900531 [Trichonephila clavipes]
MIIKLVPIPPHTLIHGLAGSRMDGRYLSIPRLSWMSPDMSLLVIWTQFEVRFVDKNDSAPVHEILDRMHPVNCKRA